MIVPVSDKMLLGKVNRHYCLFSDPLTFDIFQAFLGQKYGPIRLPTTINAEEYELVRVALHTHRGRDTRNAPLLDQCYVLDSNRLEHVYNVRDVAEIFPDIDNVSSNQKIINF